MNIKLQSLNSMKSALSAIERKDPVSEVLLRSAITDLEADIAKPGEPVDCQFQDKNGSWHPFIDERHKANTIADGRWPIRYLYTTPQEPAAAGWISVDMPPKEGRKPILLVVHWMEHGENEDGGESSCEHVEVTEGEYVPAHGEGGGYFSAYSRLSGDGSWITHWMPLPAAPGGAA